MLLQSQQAVQLFQRVRDFLVRTQPTFRLSELQPHIDSLAQVADRLASVAIEQDTRRRSGRSGTAQLSRAMRELTVDYMRPVARASKALFRGDQALLTSLSIPPRVRRPWDLVSVAGAMANAAEPYAARFAAAGFVADMPKRLRDAAAVVQDALNRRAQELARRAAATAAIREEMSRGRAIIAMIDAMVALRLEGDPEAAAEWRSLIRQGKTRRPEPEGGAVGGGSGTLPVVVGEVKAAA